MAGWSMMKGDDQLRDSAKRQRELALVPSGSVVGLENGDLRSLFDRVLAAFLRATCGKLYRPVPPVVGDDKVDLFRLFSVVREKGGFDFLQENLSLWESVIGECGLRLGSPAALVLVYRKYLLELERLLGRIGEGNGTECGRDLSGCLMLLEAELNEVSSGGDSSGSKFTALKWKDEVVSESNSRGSRAMCNGLDGRNDVVVLDVDENSGDDGGCCVVDAKSPMLVRDVDSKYVDGEENSCLSMVKCEMNTTDVSIPSCKDEIKGPETESDGTTRNDDDDEDDVMLLDPVQREELFSCKRKWEPSMRMLNWVTGLARDPCDPQIGSIPERSKWKLYGDTYWKQALLAREALFLKQPIKPGFDQKNMRMLPHMYDDHFGSSNREGLRPRLNPISRNLTVQASTGSESSSRIQSGMKKSLGKKDPLEKQLNLISDSETENDVQLVPIGPAFQAVVPEWSGLASESDSKWTEYRLWPLENVEHEYLIESNPTGKGREHLCDCQSAGSPECVRFHIAEKRLTLKRELGSAFFHMGFDRMGEEIRLSWTKEEERRFKHIVKLNHPTMDKSFWDEIYRCFPIRRKADLVSYYYNVFIMERRGYQNRCTPKETNSDDDAESI